MNNKCPECGQEVSKDDLMCPHCNALILDEPEESKVYICPVCGAENPPGVRSCMFCCSIMPEMPA